MEKFLANRKLFVAVTALFIVTVTVSLKAGTFLTSTTLTIPTNPILFNGPTLPPGPWDEGRVQVANGPTLPPGPWDEGRLRNPV